MSAKAHHQDNDFLFKYIFSTDHKMIAKQFFLTGSIMGLIGMLMSTIFRLQLGYPGESFPFLESIVVRLLVGGLFILLLAHYRKLCRVLEWE